MIPSQVTFPPRLQDNCRDHLTNILPLYGMTEGRFPLLVYSDFWGTNWHVNTMNCVYMSIINSRNSKICMRHLIFQIFDPFLQRREFLFANSEPAPPLAFFFKLCPLTPSEGIIYGGLASDEYDNIIKTRSSQGPTDRCYPATPEPPPIMGRERDFPISRHKCHEARAKVPYWVQTPAEYTSGIESMAVGKDKSLTPQYCDPCRYIEHK